MRAQRRLFRPLTMGAGALRRWATGRRIHEEAAQSLPRIAASQIGATRNLEILPLYEARARDGFEAGNGVSYLIRTDHADILFDLGNNPSAESPSPLERNMTRLGISLAQVDLLFISHRHPDHVGGRRWWNEKSFSLNGQSQQPLADRPVFSCDEITYPGNVVLSPASPTLLAEGVATTGAFTFFEPYPSLRIFPDYREHALAIHVTGVGLILVVGCGHMGLKTLLERVKSVFEVPLAGIIGGLHYTDAEAEAIRPDIQYLLRFHPRLVALSSHDSGPAAVDAFAQAFKDAFISIQVAEPIMVSSE